MATEEDQVNITNQLREQVRALEREMHSKAREAEKTMKKIAHTQGEVTRLWSVMNFRERSLGAWFGGDKAKVRHHRELEARVAELNSRVSSLRQEVEKLNTQANDMVDSHLRAHDPAYQSLLQPYEAASAMKKEVGLFLRKIKYALLKIGTDRGIGNSETNDAIRAAQKATAPFQLALDSYSEFLKGYHALQVKGTIGRSVGVVFDLTSNDFDFMRLVALSTVGNAESRMRMARDKVSEIDKILSFHLDETRTTVLAYAQSVRAACVQPFSQNETRRM